MFADGFEKTSVVNPLLARKAGAFGRGLPQVATPAAREVFGLAPKAREAAKVSRGSKKLQTIAREMALKK